MVLVPNNKKCGLVYIMSLDNREWSALIVYISVICRSTFGWLWDDNTSYLYAKYWWCICGLAGQRWCTESKIETIIDSRMFGWTSSSREDEGWWSYSFHLLNLKRQLSNSRLIRDNLLILQAELFLERAEHWLPFNKTIDSVMILLSEIKQFHAMEFAGGANGGSHDDWLIDWCDLDWLLLPRLWFMSIEKDREAVAVLLLRSWCGMDDLSTLHTPQPGFLAKYCWMQYRSWWMALTASLLLFPLLSISLFSA